MKENPIKAQVSATKTGGLHNDFSEQEEVMTASAMPPKFALTASAAGDGKPSDGAADAPNRAALELLGLSTDEIEAMSARLAAELVATSKRFTPGEWSQLLPAVKRLGLITQMGKILSDFYEKGEWLTSENAVSLARLEGFSYTNADGKKMGGFLELAQEGDRIGMRAIIPYDDFGKTVILNPKKTTTVLGRAVDAAKHPDGYKGAMNLPIGTNYFRFQQDAMVGENVGGVNVLDIADWSWAKNHAWLQAAVDRGDNIRFISDPMLPTTLFKNGTIAEGNTTVTGDEVGVLLHQGLAPNKESGIVGPVSAHDMLLFPRFWKTAKDDVANSGKLEAFDKIAYNRFRYRNESPDLSSQRDKTTGEVQTNFFGGSPKEAIASS